MNWQYKQTDVSNLEWCALMVLSQENNITQGEWSW